MPETAIGSEGRTVRCAKCKHSWFQEPAPLDLTERAGDGTVAAPSSAPSDQPEPAPAAAPKTPETPKDEAPVSGPSVSHWRTEDHPDAAKAAATAPSPKDAGPMGDGIAARALKQGLGADGSSGDDADEKAVSGDPADERLASDPLANAGGDDAESDGADYDFDAAYDDATGDSTYDDAFDDYDAGEGSRFDYSPPFTRRRNSLKMWTIAAGVFALLASGTAVAVNYYGLPDWFPVNRPTFGIGKADLELDFPQSQQRKEVLESGEEIVRVRGTIRNAGQASVTVPSLLIVFRDERDKNVYSWVVVPSKRELAPGESLNVTEAVTDIPASAKAVDIGWSPN